MACLYTYECLACSRCSGGPRPWSSCSWWPRGTCYQAPALPGAIHSDHPVPPWLWRCTPLTVLGPTGYLPQHQRCLRVNVQHLKSLSLELVDWEKVDYFWFLDYGRYIG